jgi:hypothetical protein
VVLAIPRRDDSSLDGVAPLPPERDEEWLERTIAE